MERKEQPVEEVTQAPMNSAEGRKPWPLPLRILGKTTRITIGTIKWLLFLLFTICIIGVFTVGFMWLYAQPFVDDMKELTYDTLSNISVNTFKELSDTKVYGDTGESVGEINILNYTYVPISDVSPYIIDGYIAVEDNSFKTHNGLDYKALLRAGLSIVKNGGAITQGGSTITQQALKNNLIDPETPKFRRKIVEAFLAPEFEKMYSKNQIMEFYVNTNFYANNIYGVGAASQYYFGKDCKDLTLAEAAILVGLSNSPATYDPVRHPDNALDKRHFVLKRMLEEGVITQKEFDEADKAELVLTLEKDLRTKENYQTSYAIHDATLRLMEVDGFEFKYTFESEAEYTEYKDAYNTAYNDKSSAIRRGGYTIYTSLNTELQSVLQQAIDDNLITFKAQGINGKYEMQGAGAVVDNQTGYVIAVVGGRGTEDEYNRAYQAKRQPGSSIKPVIVYGPAFDTGEFYPSMKIKDEKFEGGPENVNFRYNGDTSIKDAIIRSVNTIAWKVFGEITPETGLDYLSKMKFSGLSYQDNGVSALSLGGFTYGASPVEMAKAYATIANYGEYIDVGCVTRIEYQGLGVIYESHPERDKTEVYTPDTAYMLIDAMRGVLNDHNGSGTKQAIAGIDLAGKTGTTNSKKDGWFCGVSPYYSVAIWAGCDTPKRVSDLSGGTYPGYIWRDFMEAAHEGLEYKEFEKPSTVLELPVNWKGEIVTYTSGTTGLFSQIAMDKEEAEREKREEAKRKQEDTEIESKVISDLASFTSFQFNGNIDKVSAYDNLYSAISKSINKFHDESLQAKYKQQIDNEYSYRNTLIRELRDEYNAELERRRVEEEERQERIKQDRLTSAEQAVTKLESWRNRLGDFNTLLSDAHDLTEACSEYTEYTQLTSRIQQVIQEHTEYLESQATPEPIVTPTYTPEPTTSVEDNNGSTPNDGVEPW